MITDVADFFEKGCGRCPRFDTPDCSTRHWAQGLRDLRAICLEAGLTETAKWGHPCYMHADRNIVLIGAFRGDFRLTFMEAGLLSDPQGLLTRQGENTAHPNMIGFTDAGDVSRLKPVILTYLTEAMTHAKAGLRAPKPAGSPDLPEEFIAALDADPELAEAFHKLTPGRQKSYAINLNGVKKPETRLARIARFRDHILAGKGALER